MRSAFTHFDDSVEGVSVVIKDHHSVRVRGTLGICIVAGWA